MLVFASQKKTGSDIFCLFEMLSNCKHYQPKSRLSCNKHVCFAGAILQMLHPGVTGMMVVTRMTPVLFVEL